MALLKEEGKLRVWAGKAAPLPGAGIMGKKELQRALPLSLQLSTIHCLNVRKILGGKTRCEGKEEMKLELTLGGNISCSQQPEGNTS